MSDLHVVVISPGQTGSHIFATFMAQSTRYLKAHSNAPTDFARLEIDRRRSLIGVISVIAPTLLHPYSIVGQQRYSLELIIQTLIRHCIGLIGRRRFFLLYLTRRPIVLKSSSTAVLALIDCREPFSSSETCCPTATINNNCHKGGEASPKTEPPNSYGQKTGRSCLLPLIYSTPVASYPRKREIKNRSKALQASCI